VTSIFYRYYRFETGEEIVSTIMVVLFALLTLYIIISALVAHKFTLARRRMPEIDSAFEHLDHQRVTFHPRGESLNLTAWYFPSHTIGRAVIFVHGKDACRGYEFKTSSFQLAADFVQRGFSVLMLDMRGHGESEFSRMTYGKFERRDVLGAVDWLMAQGYAHSSIGVLGASMGAVSAIGAVSEEEAIGALVADSAFADYGDVMRDQFTKQSKLPKLFLPGVVTAARFLTGAHLGTFRPVEDAAWLISQPTLIIHAEDDPFIPSEHAHRLATAAMADLWITPGESHLASFREDYVAYAQKVMNFFDYNLVPSRVPSEQAIRKEQRQRARRAA
jgi:uncharacterized protein